MSRPSERRASGAHANANYFFEPRAIFVIAVVALLCFGILMIYSSSSVVAMYDQTVYTVETPSLVKSTFYLVHQIEYAAIGILAAVFLAMTDYHIWSRDLLVPMGIVTLVILLAVYMPGISAPQNGAYRWIRLGASHQLQPSEFAKVSIILIAAQLGQELNELGADGMWFGKLALFVALPLGLILFEPDKGTLAILGLTLLVMLWYCGLETTWIMGILVVAVIGVLALASGDGYSQERIDAAFDPNADPSDAAYQINQGYLAFGTGGLFGVGLGMSHQKYGYLPEEHTDYIFAVIGEEMGFVGTMLVLVLFVMLVGAGYKIARRASDTNGRLIASGFSTLMVVQLFVNVTGVTGLLPASGKPIPFLSYGGSSVVACLMMSGLVVSVSRHSELPATVYEERRSRLQLYDDGADDRRERAGLRVLAGGSVGNGRGGWQTAPSPSELRSSRDMVEALGGSITYNANGTRRINLGRNASDRLRGRRDNGSRGGA